MFDNHTENISAAQRMGKEGKMCVCVRAGRGGEAARGGEKGGELEHRRGGEDWEEKKVGNNRRKSREDSVLSWFSSMSQQNKNKKIRKMKSSSLPLPVNGKLLKHNRDFFGLFFFFF